MPTDDPLSLAILLAAILTVAVGCGLLWLSAQAARAFGQLPEMVKILRNTLREGGTLADAVAVIADLGPAPINAEFARLRTGSSDTEMFTELARRLPCFTSDYLLAAVTAADGDRRQLIDSFDRLMRLDVSVREAAQDVRRIARGVRPVLWVIATVLLSAAAIWVVWPHEVGRWMTSAIVRQFAPFGFACGSVMVVWWIALLRKRITAESMLRSFPTT